MFGSVLRLIRFRLTMIVANFVGLNRLQARKLTREGRFSVGPQTMSQTPSMRTFAHDNTKLMIGNYCSISEEAIFLLGGNHPTETVTSYPHRILWGMDGAGTDGFPQPMGDIVVGSDVWVAAGAWILGGVTIGHGAVIGNGAVVRKDVPPYGIVVGNPARLVGYRHTEEQRAALLDIAWWDWSVEEVREAVPLLANKDIDAFIASARERRPDQQLVAPTND